DAANGRSADHANWADAQLVVGATPPPPPPGSSVPRERVIGGLNQPTTFEWLPNGELMFIAEKGGIVKVFGSTGLRPTPFIDISSQVNDTVDRGLLGLAVDPFFGQNQGRDYVYLLFTYDPPQTQGSGGLAGPDESGNRPARLIRVTANPATNYTTALPNSEVILLGKNSLWQYTSRPDIDSTVNFSILPSGIVNGSSITAPAALIEDPDANNVGLDYRSTDTDFDRNNNIRDYLAGDSTSHSIGQLKFGLDGALYVTVGDGTSYNGVDPRSTRVQDVDSLSGKLLRIDPLTGRGFSDNPFYNGNLESNRSKVWSLGLRNPFRFTIQPSTGALYLGDVGWTTWEEINIATKGGNFGWPYFEGNAQNSGYSPLPQAQAFYSTGQSIAPFFSRHHDANQNPDGRGTTALIMGDFYTGNTFPAIYNGALFYNDVGQGTVYTTFLNADGTIRSTQVFDEVPYIVDMETGPDGNLYYASLYDGEIGRWKPA
ncbi:MAG: PQQ-dependent sugar dehydrogenase, partial [Microcoleus sp. SIO2G3]|nr:PQQ-dependent sugar dehydrogenase [Microcoleus sp. SIO2G3]